MGAAAVAFFYVLACRPNYFIQGGRLRRRLTPALKVHFRPEADTYFAMIPSPGQGIPREFSRPYRFHQGRPWRLFLARNAYGSAACQLLKRQCMLLAVLGGGNADMLLERAA